MSADNRPLCATKKPRKADESLLGWSKHMRNYWISGRSVFFSVNSTESRVFDFPNANCIVQLPPVETNDTASFVCSTEGVAADIGMRGNCDDFPVSVAF